MLATSSKALAAGGLGVELEDAEVLLGDVEEAQLAVDDHRLGLGVLSSPPGGSAGSGCGRGLRLMFCLACADQLELAYEVARGLGDEDVRLAGVGADVGRSGRRRWPRRRRQRSG